MAGIGVGYYLNPPADSPESPPVTEKPPSDPKQPLDKSTPDTRPPAEDDLFEPTVEGRVAIVIDDVGWSNEAASVFSDVRDQLTFAVLPGRPHSQDLYERWKNDAEFIVHMPMEPMGYPEDDPGKKALMTDMSENEVRSKLLQVLDRYPNVSGINNHMGSQFTQNNRLMATVMNVLEDRGLFYLDSRTSPASVAPETGRQAGVPVLENQVFLDNESSESSIERQLEKLVQIAREEGQSIGIGHFHTLETARVLRRKIPEYRDEGIQFVGLSKLFETSTVRDPGRDRPRGSYDRSDESRL